MILFVCPFEQLVKLPVPRSSAPITSNVVLHYLDCHSSTPELPIPYVPHVRHIESPFYWLSPIFSYLFK